MKASEISGDFFFFFCLLFLSLSQTIHLQFSLPSLSLHIRLHSLTPGTYPSLRGRKPPKPTMPIGGKQIKQIHWFRQAVDKTLQKRNKKGETNQPQPTSPRATRGRPPTSCRTDTHERKCDGARDQEPPSSTARGAGNADAGPHRYGNGSQHQERPPG